MEEYNLSTDSTVKCGTLIRSMNGVVACTPFKTTEITADKTNKYFVTPENKNALEALGVLYGTADIPAGSTAYVLASHKTSPWAQPNQVVVFNGKPLIFVPVADIRLLGY